MPPRVIGDHAAAIRHVLDAIHIDCQVCVAGVGILRLVADEIEAEAGAQAGALGRLGGAVRGKSKSRGSPEHYRAMQAKSAQARRDRKAK